MTTIQQYRGMLPVSKHRLDDELEIQADIMDRISVQVVAANTRSLDARLSLEKIEGRLASEIREDEPKLTVDAVQAKVKRDPDRDKAWQRYQEARADHEEWEGLFKSWKERGYTIKTLADLYVANYFSPTSVGAGKREQRQDDARAAMRRAGHVDRRVGAPEREERAAVAAEASVREARGRRRAE